MSQKISVPAWFDDQDKFLNGALIAVGTDAQVVGVFPKNIPYFNGGIGPFTVQALFVKDKDLGGVYLNMTLSQFLTAVGNTAIAPSSWNNLGGIPTLQQVTTEGRTTTEGVFFVNGSDNLLGVIGQVTPGVTQVAAVSANGNVGVSLFAKEDGSDAGVIFVTDLSTNKKITLKGVITGDWTQNLQDKNCTYAAQEDTPNKKTISATGNTSFVLPAGNWLTSFAANPTSSETISVGITPGGTEILPANPYTSGTYLNNGFNVAFYADVNTTIFISGAVGNVTYQILKTGL